AHVPGFAAPAATLSEERAAAANPPPARPAAAGRSGPPQPSLQPNDWNTVQVIVETDMVSITLNGRPIPANAATNDRMMGFGPIALHIAGPGEVRFREISAKDLNVKREPAE